MRKHRTHSIAFKRQVVEEYLAGETFYGLSRHPDRPRTVAGRSGGAEGSRLGL